MTYNAFGKTLNLTQPTIRQCMMMLVYDSLLKTTSFIYETAI